MAAALRVKRELEGGWFQWIAMPLPALLTIQSGINQLRYATLKGIMAAKKKEIKKVAAARRACGRRSRSSALYAADAKQADADDRRLAGRGGEGAGAAAARGGEGPVILVVAEQRDGKLNRATWEAIAAAQQLAGGLPDHGRWCSGAGVASVAAGAGRGRRAEVLTVEHAALAPYTPDAFTTALTQRRSQQTSPALVLLPHTYQTRDFAPTLAARLRSRARSPTSPASRAPERPPTFARPMFQGKLDRRRRRRRATAPHFVTFQIGAFRADAVAKGGAGAGATRSTSPIDAAAIRQKPEAPFQEAKQAVDLAQAERIVAVGRGIKAQENIALAREAGQGARRRARGVAADLRQRLAADGAPGRQLRPDGRAEALRRARHLRRHSAPRRHEGRRGPSSRSTRTPTRRSSRSPTTASSATCSRSCRR